MRADTAAFLRTGGDGGPSLVAGKAERDLLVSRRCSAHTTTSRRCPTRSRRRPQAKIAILRAWIDEGAVAPAQEEPEKNLHWAFVVSRAPRAPDGYPHGLVEEPHRRVYPRPARKQKKTKSRPPSEADRVTLLRRVTLDLIGLPPTPAEAAAFLADKSSDAYERVVERLLASPHHGERWARPWLDVARYADSNGYSIDAPRQIWKLPPTGSWTLLNRDVPYDQFVIEQLGGDLLPNATIDQKVATGFNRNPQD